MPSACLTTLVLFSGRADLITDAERSRPHGWYPRSKGKNGQEENGDRNATEEDFLEAMHPIAKGCLYKCLPMIIDNLQMTIKMIIV